MIPLADRLILHQTLVTTERAGVHQTVTFCWNLQRKFVIIQGRKMNETSWQTETAWVEKTRKKLTTFSKWNRVKKRRKSVDMDLLRSPSASSCARPSLRRMHTNIIRKWWRLNKSSCPEMVTSIWHHKISVFSCVRLIVCVLVCLFAYRWRIYTSHEWNYPGLDVLRWPISFRYDVPTRTVRKANKQLFDPISRRLTATFWLFINAL